MEKKFITPAEAISLLNEGEFIHTFRELKGMLIGCDYKRDDLIEILNNCKVELAGKNAKKIGHGIAIYYQGLLFVECNRNKLEEFDIF